MCGFCTVWMCEAYVIMWVWIWWVTAFLDYPDWGFSVLFLSCKANARVKLAKSGHGPHLFRIIVFCVVLVIVLCYCLYAVLLLLCCTVIVLLCYCLCCPMYWLCVLYHCHRVLTQLQLTNKVGKGPSCPVKGWNLQVMKQIGVWENTSRGLYLMWR